MNKTLLICLLFLTGIPAIAQDYDTAYYDSTYNYEGEYETEDIEASYNLNDPAQLPVTKDNNSTSYAKRDFDKGKWKEIVGETNYEEEKEEEEPEKKSTAPSISAPLWSGAFLKILGFGLIFALAVAVLYFIVKNTFTDESFRKLKSNDEALLFDDQHIEDVSDQDIDALLKKALAANDFRAAVRLYYIRLLKHLHGTNFIAWKKNKTNRDYTYELSTTPLVNSFQKITRAYEIIWYGERTPTNQEFEILQQNFGELHSQSTALLS